MKVANQDNCLLINLRGECVACTAGHYLDTNTFRCAVVPEIGVIENCEAYNSDQQCGLCKVEMIISNGICLPAENVIEFCKHQLDELFCLVCNDGYVLTLDARKCIKIEVSDSNCGGYTLVECVECKKDHILNRNKYLLAIKELLDSTSNKDPILDGMIHEFQGTVNQVPAGVCQPVTVSNCSVFNDFNDCKSCEAGHFLTPTKDCEVYPDDVIADCFIYLSLSVCKQCNNGFYIGPDNDCLPVVEIENCAEYNATAKKSECVKCLQEFYLVSDSQCTERANPVIVECLDYTAGEDNCENCNPDFILTTDRMSCKPEIFRCAEYALSTQNDETLKCSKCEDGFYVSEDICVEGTVDNCKTYALTTDDCVTCLPKHYLQSSRSCSEHSTIKNCSVYSGTQVDVCDLCDNDYIGFTITNKCAPASSITGCILYANDKECLTCDEGFLFQNDSCTALPTEMNCLVADSLDVCTKCKANYILYNDKCYVNPGYITTNCDTSNINDGLKTLETAKCEQCKDGTISWNFKDYYICYEDTWVDLLTTNPIDNCKQLKIEANNSRTCLACDDGWFLQSNNCVNTCNDYIKTHTIAEVTTGVYEITTGKVCTDTPLGAQAIPNCEVYTYGNTVTGNNEEVACIKCKGDKAMVIDPAETYSTGMKGGATLNDLTWEVESPVAFFPKIKACIDLTSVTFENAADAAVTGCRYYQEFTGPKYGCVSCDIGKRGKIAASNGNYVIESCETTTCSPDFRIGLPVELNSRVSCFECTDTTKMPFLFIASATAYDGIDGYFQYDLDAAANDFDSASDNDFNINCHSKDGSDFTGISNFNLPAKCAIGAFNVNTSTASAADAASNGIANTNNLAVFCISCIGGYRAKKMTLADNSVVPFAIYECEEINGCSNTSWYNYCGACDDNFAFKYEPVNGVDYTECISFEKDPNCYAATEAVNGDCEICKKGYQLNKDEICEMINPLNCKENMFHAKQTMKRSHFGALMYLNPEGQGCLKCETSFTSVLVSENTPLCVNSDYLAQVNAKETTNYIQNCTGYYLDEGEQKCKRCKTGFVLANNNIQCFPLDQLENCVIASSEKDCAECIDGYVPVSKKCRKKEIVNCVNFVMNPEQESQTCVTCKDGFYLSQNKCIEGKIVNCKSFTSNGEKCTQCIDGFIKVDAGNQDYCFQKPSDTTCDTFSSTKFRLNDLNCEVCKTSDPLYIEDDLKDDTTFICLPITEITHCVTYQNDGLIRNSTLRCSKCKDEFFVNESGTCTERETLLDGCLTPSLDSDKCLTCDFGYFLDTENGVCIANPIGIAMCRVYLNAKSCLACKENAYIRNNFCFAVPEDQRVDNCLYYSDPASCKECAVGFILDNEVCKQAQAKDCLTIKSATECSTCEPRKGLKTVDGVTSCVANPDGFCIDFIQVFPFVCTKCKTGYYPGDNGTCAKATANISRCSVYLNATQCKTCNAGYVLTSEKTKCSNTLEYQPYIEEECNDLVTQGSPLCVYCKGGFIFGEDGTCKKVCATGCHFCDSENVDICFVCESGYVMDKTQKCAVAGGPPPAPEPESASLMSVMMLFLSLFVVIGFN